MISRFKIPIQKKRVRAKRLALWSIGLGFGYPLIICILLSLRDIADRNSWSESLIDLATILSYLAFPLVILLWIFSIRSLTLSKSNLGILALILTILFTLALVGILYALSQICVIC